jgi:threonine dehydratase
MDRPTLRDVYRARRAIAPFVRRTPVVSSPVLSARAGRPVYLKLENLQETGSFKLRGAASKLCSLGVEERARGVVAVSTGNHGRAVAHIGRALGVRVAVCLSDLVPDNKRAAIAAEGAELHVGGSSQDQAMTRAEELTHDQGLTWAPPFDDPAVISGQGTIGLELLEDVPDLGAVLVPLSGGGLLAGVALALKSADPAIQTVGVSAERVSVMFESLRAGRPLELPEQTSLADSLGGGLGRENRYTFRLVRELVDDHAIVSEAEIAASMALVFRHHGLVLEGAGAVGIAALVAGKIALRPGPVAVVLSGGNVDPDDFLHAILSAAPLG